MYDRNLRKPVLMFSRGKLYSSFCLGRHIVGYTVGIFDNPNVANKPNEPLHEKTGFLRTTMTTLGINDITFLTNIS